MEMPTLKDIFCNIDSEKISTYELEDHEQSLRRTLEIMIEKKKIKRSAAKRIVEIENDICYAAKSAGFAQGFVFALRLLCFPD